MSSRESFEHRSGRVLTASNALTFSRILSIPVVAALLLARVDGLAAVVFVVAAATDFFDGWLARRGGATTYLGQVLDPIADRLFLSGIALVLAVRGLLPGWAVAVLIGRDLLALVGSLVFRGKIRVNRVGKAATALLMSAVALVVIGESQTGIALGGALFYAGLALSLTAGFMYARRIYGNLRGGG